MLTCNFNIFLLSYPLGLNITRLYLKDISIITLCHAHTCSIEISYNLNHGHFVGNSVTFTNVISIFFFELNMPVVTLLNTR